VAVVGERQLIGHRLSSFFFRHPRFRLAALLTPGMVWLGVVYLGSLAALTAYGFFRLQEFTGLPVPDFSLDTYRQLWDPANRDIIVRTTLMAASVTVACGVIAFPLAYYMARFASPRAKTLLYVGVLMPLWSSYLVRVLSWKLILARDGIATWFLDHTGLSPVLDLLLRTPAVGGPSLSTSDIGRFLVFVYTWLPYMILPLHAALERVPESFVEASGDLGAKPRLTFRRIILPLALPGLAAGSIFTFSLTLGDFIIPGIIGDSSYFIGARVLQATGVESNLPLAAAFSVVPMVVMVLYLLGAKRVGAFEAL
jgi:putative spermidine/putrescine transport system permease protein